MIFQLIKLFLINHKARKNFKKNWLRTWKIATQIPLIHVSGNPERIPFEHLLLNSGELPTSITTNYCSSATLEAEEALNLGSCLYFYAGRAHPSFGKIALAFNPEIEIDHSGSVTPFDTGGLYADKIIGKFNNKTEFVRSSTIDLKYWRFKFWLFLAFCFSSPIYYWSDQEYRLTKYPGSVHSIKNEDWRAWAFEVRVYEPQSIFEVSEWCATENQHQNILNEVLNHYPPGGALPPLIEEFLNKSLEPIGSPNYYTLLEEKILYKLKIAVD